MIVTIHQPEHFPYMGYFQKMKNSDIFVVLDDVKFKKNNWQNRNKYLSRQGNEEWFGVSVPKKSNGMLIKDVKVVDDKINPWKRKVIERVKYNLDFDLSSFYDHDSLCEINLKSIEWARQKMKIKTPMIKSSSLGCEGKRSELLANICKKLNAKTYLSGQTGKDYLDTKFFEGINVEFFEPKIENYYTCIYNLRS